VHEVRVEAMSLDRLAPLVGPRRMERFDRTATATRDRLAGRRVINVNSTGRGGGVAELLQTLLAYGRGAGLDVRWLVIDGDPLFFEITKRIHNHLYGGAGDGGPLGPRERAHYADVAQSNAAALRRYVRPGDVIVLHDPHTAALVPEISGWGVRVVWRCHVGVDVPNDFSEKGWSFLRPFLYDVDSFVFSRASFAPAWIPSGRLSLIPPSIDPFSAKNVAIAPERVTALLQDVGLLAEDGAHRPMPFVRRDGTRGAVTCLVDLNDTGPAPPLGVPVVLQASRWDRMKDMPGVMVGFADSAATTTDAHLILAGPATDGVDDDPEANAVLRDCRAEWARLPSPIRARVHLACVPMTDADEAATIVNALQRHATVVVQKSLAEGFGLTVTEAMWKSRPVVASAVGGLADQVVPGQTGWLVEPNDLALYGSALCSLLSDPEAATAMGVAGYKRAVDEFLADRHLEQWATVFEKLQ